MLWKYSSGVLFVCSVHIFLVWLIAFLIYLSTGTDNGEGVCDF